MMKPIHTTPRSRLPSARRRPRGAATLVVVMVLFFIVALVAAYTSRNLIFEQRASSNQYRATQAFEAAEAGLEWALAMLNSSRIDATCQPLVDPETPVTPDSNSFRQRYLDVNADGNLGGRFSDGQPLRPACVFDGINWQCSCPADADPSLAEPTGTGPFPAFVLRFSRNDPAYPAGPAGPYPPGIIRIESTGCTRLDTIAGCAAAAASGDGRATVTILAALKSALVTPPTAAVTVHDNLIREDSARLLAVNSDSASRGITVQVGQLIHDYDPAWLSAQSLPGTPGDQSFVYGDPLLQGLNADGMFASAFGMARATYRLQPAAVKVDCAIDCSATTVRDMALLNPDRVLWIEGAFDLDIADPIGTATSPVAMVVTGNVTVSNADAKVNGVVYTSGGNWASNGGLTLIGALIAEADLTLSGTGTSTIVYNASALGLLNKSSGSFVRVPGSWRDF